MARATAAGSIGIESSSGGRCSLVMAALARPSHNSTALDAESADVRGVTGASTINASRSNVSGYSRTCAQEGIRSGDSKPMRPPMVGSAAKAWSASAISSGVIPREMLTAPR